MSIKTFLPPLPPDVGGSRKTANRVNSLNLGDGYSQRTGDGLNAQSDELTLSWSQISEEDAGAIDVFFEGLEPGECFYWLAPRKTESQKWTCDNWTRSFSVNDSISLTFKEAFDLDV